MIDFLGLILYLPPGIVDQSVGCGLAVAIPPAVVYIFLTRRAMLRSKVRC